MKGFYGALLAAMLLAPAGAALANQAGDADSGMESGKVGSAATEEGSMKPQGGGTGSGDAAAQGAHEQGAHEEIPPADDEVPRADDDIPSGPDEDMSTQSGSANTEPGDTEVQGGSAAGGSSN